MQITRPLPDFRELADDDIHAILARNIVGRLAFAWGGEVDIRPLNYVYSDGAIYGRTSPGEKFLRAEGLPAPVVFEVDEVETVLRWRSVIVRGQFDILLPGGPDSDEWMHAINLLGRVVKDTFGRSDPVPERNLIFRVTVEQATGRASR